MLSIFSRSRSGTLYEYKTRLSLGDADGVNLKFPCALRISQRKRVTVTDVAGLPDTVKQVQGLAGYEIAISTYLGDYDTPLIGGPGAPLVAKDSLTDLAQFIASQHGPVKILDEAGILAGLNISYIVFGGSPMEVDQDPSRPGVLNVSLSVYSELMPDTGALEILTEEEPS